MPTEIFPDTFFNYSNPSSPLVSIQFRTKVSSSSGITSAGIWEDITAPPSSFFQNLTLEDNGGIIKFNLTLLDKNFVTLERVLTKTILSTKLSNDLTKTGSGAVPASIENRTIDWQYKINNASMANIRIRFGYSDMVNGLDTTNFGSSFEARTGQDRPVLRTPWIYLMISNFSRSFGEEGLTINLEGFSVSTVFFDTVKVIKRGMTFRHTPDKVIEYLGEMVSKASDGQITVEIDGEAKEYLKDAVVSQDGSRHISLNLGAPINETDRTQLRTLRSIFDEITSLVPAKIYTLNETEEPLDPTGAENQRLKNADHIVPFKYSVSEEENGRTKILFYYPDPFNPKPVQNTIRTYIWKEYGQSIVRNLNIESKLDFAALNSQVLIVESGTSGSPPIVSLAAARTNAGGNEEDSHLGSEEEVTKAIDSEEFGDGFVIDGEQLRGQNKLTDVAARVMTRIINEINDQIFQGTIELIGDPFFLFDNVIRPYQYLIRILLLKPSYVDATGKYIGPELSNVSGNYYLTKITHNIGIDGFITTLGIKRLPERGLAPDTESARSTPPPPARSSPSAEEVNPPVQNDEELVDRETRRRIDNNLDVSERHLRAQANQLSNSDPTEAGRLFSIANRLAILREDLENGEDLNSFINRLSPEEREYAGL